MFRCSKRLSRGGRFERIVGIVKEQSDRTIEVGPVGVIDSLSAGLSVITRYPQLLLLPILLDLFLWLGPPLVLGQRFIATILSALDLQNTDVAFLDRPAGEAGMFMETIRAELEAIDLWNALVPPLFWPSVLDRVAGNEAVVEGWALQVDSVISVLAVLLLLIVVGLFLNVFWLNGVVRAVEQRPWLTDGQFLLRRTVRQGVRLGMGVLLLLALMVGLFVPAAFTVSIIGLVVPGAGQFLLGILEILMLWGVIWLLFHLFYMPAAIVVGDMGLLQAPRWSYKLVRRFFWSTFGFVMLSLLLTVGFGLIWLQLSYTVAGLALSVVANAALGTAIAAAMLIFFKQRSHLLMEESV